MRVQQLTNNRGKPVANHFVITDDTGATFLQSYQTIIAKVTFTESGEYRKITLDRNNWAYSKTTSRWRNYWLGLTTSETLKRIEIGKITLDDLN